MPKTIRAAKMGFCSGVHRVLRLVTDALEESTEVATLGAIVHNRHVGEWLKNTGVVEIDELDNRFDGAVITGAHGVSPPVLESLRNRAALVFDGTCPRVGKLHDAAIRYAGEGATVVVFGDSGHAEVRGIVARAHGAIVLSTVEDIDSSDLHGSIVVLAQTTFGRDHFERMSNAFKRRYRNSRIIDSLCPAVDDRVTALIDLCSRVDAVVVIGGKNSANTKRLFEAALACNVHAWHIEGVDEIPAELSAFSSIGITAGASTPEWVIDSVEAAIESV